MLDTVAAPIAPQQMESVTPLGLGEIWEQQHFTIAEEKIVERVHRSLGGDDTWDELTKQLIRSSCAFFAQEFLTGPPEPPYEGRFLIGEHHDEWDDLVSDYFRLCVLSSRDSGKCQRGDALILTPSGKRVRIDEWSGGMLWAYDTDTHNFVETHAPASRPNGVKRVLRVTTKSGRSVVVTENHPLRLLDSWCRADELQVGQRVAVPYRSPTTATGHVDDAWLIGLLVGDGGLTGSNVILSTNDDSILEAVRREGIDARYADQYDYRLLGMQPRMRELGLMGCTSHTKRVPAQIFESSLETIAEFIAGYMDADAHVSLGATGSVEFYSVSEELLRDVQHLLTRLGVVASILPKRGKYRGEIHWSWRLRVSCKDLIHLSEVVSPRGVRREQLLELATLQAAKGKASGKALDRFPRDVWGKFQNPDYWFQSRGLPRVCRQYEPTREKIRTMAEAEGNGELLALVDSDVLWDEVVDIEDLGEDETWSIHVPGFENYLADDVINHNTFFFDFAYPLWKIVTQPGGSGFIFSATQEQATRILADIKHELESNPRLQYLVPSRKSGSRWSATSIQCTNGHRIYARGFGTKVRGAHPCLDHDTELVTDRGVEKIGDLVGTTRRVLTGLGTWKVARFWKSGTKEVVTSTFGAACTRDKQKLVTTPDHKVLTASRSWQEVAFLEPGEVMALPPSQHDTLFEALGWLWNDGKYTNGQHFIMFGEKDGEALERYRPYLTSTPKVTDCVYRISKSKIQTAIDVAGEGYKKKCVKKEPPLATMDAQQRIAWVRGMLSANGTVVRSVRLKLASKPVVEFVESVLHEFGVATTPIVTSRSKEGFTSHTIHVHKKSIAQYLAVFGFVQAYKMEKAKSLAFPFWRLAEVPKGRRPRKTKTEVRDVFDFQIAEPSCEQEMSAISNGVVVHNCWIVVDDGLNDETAYSELIRRKQIEYFYSAITNMIVPGGQIIVVGTPFYATDLYGDLSQNPEYEFRRYQALFQVNGIEHALWPARYPVEALKRKRNEIGSVRFTREFMCEPVSDDSSLFPGYLFAGPPTEQPTLKLGMPKKFWDDLGVTIFIGVDFALSSSVQADYTVIWVMGLDKHGNRWIIDIVRGKGIPYQQQLSKMNAIGKKYDPALMFLESNQAQRIFGDELIRTTDLPIKLFTTGVAKNALDKGVPSLRVLLENRKFRIPRGDARSVELTDMWIDEMRNITFQEGKVVSVGSHDDLAMASWICDQAIRTGGFSFDFGDDTDVGTESFDNLMSELTGEEEYVSDGEDDNVPEEGASFGNLIDDEDDPFSVRQVPIPSMPEVGRWF